MFEAQGGLPSFKTKTVIYQLLSEMAKMINQKSVMYVIFCISTDKWMNHLIVSVSVTVLDLGMK